MPSKAYFEGGPLEGCYYYVQDNHRLSQLVVVAGARLTKEILENYERVEEEPGAISFVWKGVGDGEALHRG